MDVTLMQIDTKRSHRKKGVFLIAAGPTVEPIDPVRYISNYSTGSMGYELALAALNRNYKVIFIHGPIDLTLPRTIKAIKVDTALEMRRRVLDNFKAADYVVMAAAVCDFRAASVASSKIKKDGKSDYWLKLNRNPDILKELGAKKGRQVLVGYSLETDSPLENAKKKLRTKKLDFIVANTISRSSKPFGSGLKSVTLLARDGRLKRIKDAPKREIASQLLDFITGYKALEWASRAHRHSQ
jgi:phosphopantothenoylcysteine decarboxylase/phosphopantothenate--cysteine ligase